MTAFRVVLARPHVRLLLAKLQTSSPMPKTGENFRLLYDSKGRYKLHHISAEEAKVSPKFQYSDC